MNATPAVETPDDIVQIVLGRGIHQIDRSVGALAKWLRENPAPDVKPTGNDNASQLAFLVTLLEGQRGFGHPKKTEVHATHGWQFDLDGVSEAELVASLKAVRAAGHAAVFWKSHSATPDKPAGRLIVLADSPMPPEAHERTYHVLRRELCPTANTAAQFNWNRGWNRPRAGTLIVSIGTTLVDWRSVLERAPAPSELKRSPAEIPAPLSGLAAPAAAVVESWVAGFPKERGKRDACFAFGGWACRQGIPEDMARDFIEQVLARIPEVESVSVGLDSVSESYVRLEDGRTAYGRPTLIELMGEQGPAAIEALERAWGLKSAQVDLVALGLATVADQGPGDEIKINADMVGAMATAEADLARRDDLFVWQGSICQALGGRLIPLSTENLRALSTAQSRWLRFDSDSQRWVEARADKSTIQALKDRGHWPLLKTVRGVISAPIWVNGRALGTPGYDVDSRLYYDGPAYERTSRTEPTEALVAELLHPFRHFPWKVDGAKTAALSYLFSMLLQYDYTPPTPLHAFSADQQKGGKGLLARAMTLLVLGRAASITAFPATGEELNKFVLGVLHHGGRRAVLLDEPGRTVGGPVFRAVVTSEIYEGRKLGVNQTIGGLNMVVWAVLGNMLRMGDDMMRRIVGVVLGAQTATDLPDLLDEIEANRASLLDCAFELIARWEAAGAPRHKLPEGLLPSFEGWSRKVESLLAWAGLPSLRDNTSEIQDAQAEEQTALFELVDLACALKGGAGATPNEILATARLHPDLAAEAFGDAVNHRVVGAALRRCQVALGGTRLVRPTNRTWKVERPR